MLGRIRPTVRLRLALTTGGLVVLAGAAVLGLTYFFLSHPPHLMRFICRGTPCPAGLHDVTVLQRTGGLPPLSGLPPDVQQAIAALRAHFAASLRSGRVPRDVIFLARSVSLGQRAADLRQFLVQGGLALAILAVLSAGLSWWLAGRALRPLQVMTRRVRDLSTQTPLGRIRLAGPDDELKALGDTFDALLARLDAARDAERRFVANASHELRTPLAIQETLLDVGLGDPNADVRSLREMAGRLRQANRRSRHLIEGLLTLAHSQQGLARSDAVDLAAVARDAAEASAPDASANAVRIEQDLHPAPVRGDPVLLERLAGNLVENAVRYNTSGGWVRVGTEAKDRYAVLTVANSGPIVPPDGLNELFEPFRRGGRDRTDSHRGAGLGLSIVHAVAAAHAGTVVAAAPPEGGLVLTVTLPLSDAPPDEGPQDGAPVLP